MKVGYKGISNGFSKRAAVITYDENKEQILMDKIKAIMNAEDWQIIQLISGYSYCLVGNAEEYKEFVKDYKDAKKIAKAKVSCCKNHYWFTDSSGENIIDDFRGTEEDAIKYAERNAKKLNTDIYVNLEEDIIDVVYC